MLEMLIKMQNTKLREFLGKVGFFLWKGKDAIRSMDGNQEDKRNRATDCEGDRWWGQSELRDSMWIKSRDGLKMGKGNAYFKLKHCKVNDWLTAGHSKANESREWAAQICTAKQSKTRGKLTKKMKYSLREWQWRNLKAKGAKRSTQRERGW